MKRSRMSRAAAFVIGAAAAATITGSAAAQSKLAVGDVIYSARDAATKLMRVKTLSNEAVQVTGAGTKVTLDCAGAVAKKGAGLALSSVSFGIHHLDKGTHGFQIGVYTGTAGIQDDLNPVAGVQIICNEAPVAGVQIICNEVQIGPKAALKNAPATIAPTFAGAATYTLRVVKNGKTLKTLAGQSGAFAIRDFDDDHDGKEETLGFAMTFGTERPGAWTMTLTHGVYVIVITAEATQTLARGGARVALTTSGLDWVRLTDQAVSAAKP